LSNTELWSFAVICEYSWRNNRKIVLHYPPRFYLCRHCVWKYKILRRYSKKL